MSSFWQYNMKAEFAIYPYKGEDYLVCYSTVGNFRIHFVESVATGERQIPSAEQRAESPNSKELIVELIKNILD
ncbi:hypothetical protein [Indiicoccus explosivorum]|uniref:hypothetical protein n=1 Tax=Indiicoccus explosivorum TaxID=1917864 RepID=UPI000B430B91|nr:hypothetical protein [Indiicoccus explosivorum]